MTESEKIGLIEMLAKNGVRIGQVIFEVAGDNHYHENERQEVTTDVTETQIGHALEQVQAYMWGQSAYAVIFCALRDYHGFTDNMSQFERVGQRLAASHQLQWTCPDGTLRAAFKNNPYYKLKIDKWRENGVADRVMLLIEKFEELLGP